MTLLKVAACVLALGSCTFAFADDKARFDLAGPKISVRVTRGGATLPIAQVPNLQAGDKLWVKADLPATQSNHLLLVVTFLRGTTNEPPDNWFTEIDTWDKKAQGGTTITVPDGAEQAVMFLAPETGGDFKTLRSAVKGKPGLFIRADADLNEASFEQQRIERYLAGMKTVSKDDPKAIQEHSAKLAAALALKPNADCFKQPVNQQVTCLTQSSAPVLLEDGHGQNVAEALSSGPSSDFINAASYTPQAGGGNYSAYVGAVVDLVGIMSKLRTAQYVYIPAIAFPQGETLNLKLNTPPSFHKPETVMVIGLPAIQKAKLPPLKAQNANQVACMLQPKPALLLEGAPLVFSTSFAHDLVLHLNRNGDQTDIPLTPDAFEGGLILDKAKAKPGTDLIVTGTIHGMWGFDKFDGPTLSLQQVDAKNWKVLGDTQLMAGKDNKLTLQGDAIGCVEKIQLVTTKDKDVDVSFKPGDPKDEKQKNTLALTVPLKSLDPGGYALSVQQYGESDHQKVPLTAYSSDIKFDELKIHAGDNKAVLTGNGAKEVVSAQIGDQTFTPAAQGNDDKTVHLEAKSGVTPAKDAEAEVKLKDGRTLKVKIAAEAARPGLKLVSFKATPAEQEGSLPIKLSGKDEIPLNGKLTFVVQTADTFPRTQTVEVATANQSAKTTLSIANNTLVLQDEHTAVATLDPLKAFGQSAFGKLAIRPVAADGTTGEWTGLGILVRTPQITAIKCEPSAPTCTVEGSNLFLAQSFAAAADFAKPTDVPTGFADKSFAVPAPADGATVYLKLRDDPGAVATVSVPK